MEHIGARIKRVRDELERTQVQFAKDIGVKRGAVGNWELGKRPSLENLFLIAKKTLVPMEWFMEGADDEPIPFGRAAQQMMLAASDPAITPDEAAAIVELTFRALRAEIPEAEARVVARAVIKAYRRQPAPPELPLSDEEKRSAVFEAIRLFLPE